MASRRVSRRRFVASTAALSGAMVAAPFVRGAYAAGKLSVGFWDHWVPNANAATEKAVKEWAEKEKVDVTIEQLVKDNGKVNATVEYLGKVDGKWLALPATVGSQFKGPCSRIDLMKKHAGIDVQAMYPAGAEPQDKDWTFDTFLKAAEACSKGGN